MERTEIAIFVAVLFVAAFRIYQKYGKKGQGDDKKFVPGSKFSSSSRDDDYEPYAKKMSRVLSLVF